MHTRLRRRGGAGAPPPTPPPSIVVTVAPGKRLGAAREPIDIHGHGDQHDGHQRELERERHCRREFRSGHDHKRRRVYRPRGSACHGDRSNHGDEPRGCDQIRFSQRDDHQRYRAGADAEFSKHGIRRDTDVPSKRREQRSSRYRSALESFRRGVPQRPAEVWTAAGITRRLEFFLPRQT